MHLKTITPALPPQAVSRTRYATQWAFGFILGFMWLYVSGRWIIRDNSSALFFVIILILRSFAALLVGEKILRPLSSGVADGLKVETFVFFLFYFLLTIIPWG